MAGAESSPFPDDSGDKAITFLPLTLEPFNNHELPMAEIAVGEMVRKSKALLGSRRVNGFSLLSRGSVSKGKVKLFGAEAIGRVRDEYRELGIAIFGCGDLERDGWLEKALRSVEGAENLYPATDLCLNLFDERGERIPLPGDREFVTIGVSDIKRLVQRPDRLALLLTSGAAKGKPIVVAARAGCLDTLICDEAAAEAALKELREGGAPGGAA